MQKDDRENKIIYLDDQFDKICHKMSMGDDSVKTQQQMMQIIDIMFPKTHKPDNYNENDWSYLE